MTLELTMTEAQLIKDLLGITNSGTDAIGSAYRKLWSLGFKKDNTIGYPTTDFNSREYSIDIVMQEKRYGQ